MSYDTRIEGTFVIEPPVADIAAIGQSLRSWRVSPNGRLLYLPTDSDETDALGTLHAACKALGARGHSVNGSGTWRGEDGEEGSLTVVNNVISESTNE